MVAWRTGREREERQGNLGEAVRKLDTAVGSVSPCACLEACLSSDITSSAGTSAFPDVYCIVWLEWFCTFLLMQEIL